MHSIPVRAWFKCKLCSHAFAKLELYIEHKKQKHFSEFQETKCFIFEETATASRLINHSLEPWCYSVPDVDEALSAGDEDKSQSYSDRILDRKPSLHSDGIDNDTPLTSLLGNQIPGTACNAYNNEAHVDSAVDFKFIVQDGSDGAVKMKEEAEVESVTLNYFQNSPSDCNRDDNCSNIDPFRNETTVPSDTGTDDEITIIDHVNLPPTSTLTPVNSTEAVWECQICSKKFTSEPQHRIHVGICSLYNKKKPPTGNDCNTHRASENNGPASQNTSSKVNLKCHLCSKVFKRAYSLHCHLQAHKAEKSGKSRVACQFCTRTFKAARYLHVHLKTHSTARPFCCSRCNATFKLRKYLTQHMKVCISSKVFPCSQSGCESSFSTEADLETHINVDHTVQYFCSVNNCSESFSEMNLLNDHVLRCHGPPEEQKIQQGDSHQVYFLVFKPNEQPS